MRLSHTALTRRHLLCGSAACLTTGSALASIPAPPGNRLSFKVIREGKDIGTHRVAFTRNGDVWTIETAIDLAVTFGPVTFYRYRHRAEEIWTAGLFTSISAETNDDGKALKVQANRTGRSVAVTSTQSGTYEAPAQALPATHWNRRMIEVPFINMQTGELTQPVVSALGTGDVETASGRKINVRRFLIEGPPKLETWYDERAAWAGLRFKGKDGSEIAYQRQD